MLSSVPWSSRIFGYRSWSLATCTRWASIFSSVIRCIAEVGRMVGDRVVGVPMLGGRLEHALQRGEPVGEVGVRVQVAADLLQRDQVGQLAGERGLDLATVLPQRRLDAGQAERS